MIIFKVLLIILLAAPVVAATAFLYVKAREYSIRLTRRAKKAEIYERDNRRYRDYYR